MLGQKNKNKTKIKQHSYTWCQKITICPSGCLQSLGCYIIEIEVMWTLRNKLTWKTALGCHGLEASDWSSHWIRTRLSWTRGLSVTNTWLTTQGPLAGFLQNTWRADNQLMCGQLQQTAFHWTMFLEWFNESEWVKLLYNWRIKWKSSVSLTEPLCDLQVLSTQQPWNWHSSSQPSCSPWPTVQWPPSHSTRSLLCGSWMYDVLCVFETAHRKPCTGGDRFLKYQRLLSAAEGQDDRRVQHLDEQPGPAGARRVSSAHTGP